MGRKLKVNYEQGIEGEKNQLKIEKMLLRGITNQNEIANALGVTQPCVSQHVKAIRQKWREADLENEEGENLRALRIRQIEGVALLALNSYERSREDAVEHTISYKVCESCYGEGFVEGKPGVFDECVKCEGTGKLEVETVKTKGQAGDSTHLNVARMAFVEAAKLNGLYPSQHGGAGNTVAVRKMKEMARAAGGQIEREVEEIWIEGDVDLLVQAKVLMEELENSVKNGESKVIDVESR